VLDLIHEVRISMRLLATLVGVIAIVGAFMLIRRRAHINTASQRLPEELRVEVGLMAGLFATITTAVIINLVLYALAMLDHTAPLRALMDLNLTVGRRLGLRTLPTLAVVTVLHVALQLGWAVLYAHIERWLPHPDWLGGLLFALAPLAVSLLVVLPLLGAGVAGFGLELGPVPLAGEVLRHAIYGWALSVSYSLLSRPRAAPGAATTPAGCRLSGALELDSYQPLGDSVRPLA